jgi:hypothetical protein
MRKFGCGVVLVALSACGAEGPVSDDPNEVDVVVVSAMSDQEKALYALRVAGFAAEEVVPFQEGFLVQGDIYLRTSDLVARTDLAVQKGYWCGQNEYRNFSDADSCFFNPIQMNMSTGIAIVYEETDPNFALRNGFRLAAAHWSQAHDHLGHGSDLYIDGAIPHKQPMFFNIAIRTQDLGPNGPIAVAEWPFIGPWGVEPGRSITINMNPVHFGITLNSINMTKLALHELGHTFGFAHPEAAGGNNNIRRISGTSSGTDYPTVMHADYNDTADPALYYDDNRSLVATYTHTSDLPATPNASFCDASTGFSLRNGCDVGEGDCDGEGTSAECKGTLECGRNRGPSWELPGDYDVCEKPASCAPYTGDNNDYCNSIDCPCGPLEGDCDLDSHCGGRLICGHDRGLAAGKSATWDLCILPPIPGCPTFKKADIASYAEFCSAECPCNLGEGDCDGDAECRGDLVCVTAGVALGYGNEYRVWDFCVSPEF